MSSEPSAGPFDMEADARPFDMAADAAVASAPPVATARGGDGGAVGARRTPDKGVPDEPGLEHDTLGQILAGGAIGGAVEGAIEGAAGAVSAVVGEVFAEGGHALFDEVLLAPPRPDQTKADRADPPVPGALGSGTTDSVANSDQTTASEDRPVLDAPLPGTGDSTSDSTMVDRASHPGADQFEQWRGDILDWSTVADASDLTLAINELQEQMAKSSNPDLKLVIESLVVARDERRLEAKEGALETKTDRPAEGRSQQFGEDGLPNTLEYKTAASPEFASRFWYPIREEAASMNTPALQQAVDGLATCGPLSLYDRARLDIYSNTLVMREFRQHLRNPQPPKEDTTLYIAEAGPQGVMIGTKRQIDLARAREYNQAAAQAYEGLFPGAAYMYLTGDPGMANVINSFAGAFSTLRNERTKYRDVGDSLSGQQGVGRVGSDQGRQTEVDSDP
ncbi:MAG TPA: hypothetical protein VH482_28230 [Thermomicrobiales bacterium]